ncbi:MAG: hypothetical protein BHW64_03330 [Candidatus Melainabacteria bacterium LEY3_CP_29_8]|nr:MAG: hypothetical protein BHW64_03330 [Candidatus Melainabacteria bacterium LEY3_CP_29_8]
MMNSFTLQVPSLAWLNLWLHLQEKLSASGQSGMETLNEKMFNVYIQQSGVNATFATHSQTRTIFTY